MTGIETWRRLAAGEEVGPVVSPLCDDWSLDVPYRWPYDEPDPFPPGHRQHILSQQMAMAKLCGWQPTFLCGVEFTPRREEARPQTTTEPIAGGSRTTSILRTPLGELKSIAEQQLTARTVKAWLETEEDYRRMAWVTRQQCEYDEARAVAQGQECRRAIGDRGPMGIWFGPPWQVNHDEMYFHLADFPAAVEELHEATRELQFRQLATLRKAGYDYLFYCVDGTEWISPDFFRSRYLDDIRETFRRWRALGGWILWHSCGRIARFIEAGFYNELLPEVFETMSEPPVGDLPGLRWARERLDRRIATKGNLPLNVLLQGSPEDVRREVRRIREQTAGFRHVVGLSDDVLKNTPLANARAFVEAASKS